MNVHQTRMDRRTMLKGGAALGLSTLLSSTLLSACGGGSSSDDEPGEDPNSSRETRTLHFDLSHGRIAEPRLELIRSRHHKHPLLVHDEQSRAKHRQLNQLLRHVPDEKLTHYLEDVDLPAKALQIGAVSGKAPGTNKRMLAGHFMHAPADALQAVADRRAAAGHRARKVHSKFAVLGVTDNDLTDTPIDSQIAYNSMPDAVAVWMIFSNPAVANCMPDLGADILDRIWTLPCGTDDSCVPDYGQLAYLVAEAIGGSNYPTTDDTGSWAQLMPVIDMQTGAPVVDDEGELVYRYEINATLLPALKDVTRQILNDINSDDLFCGTNWTPRDGTEFDLSKLNVPSVETATATAVRKLAANADQLTLTCGVPVGERLNGLRLKSMDADDQRRVSLSVRNETLRTVGVYVAFLDVDRNPLAVGDQLPATGLDTERSTLLTLVPPAMTVMGVPVFTSEQPSYELSFVMPDNASYAEVYYGSLGTGGQSFTPEAKVGACLTLCFNIAIPAIALAAGLAVEALSKSTNETLKNLVTNPGVLKAFMEMVGSSGVKNGIFESCQTQRAGDTFIAAAEGLLRALLTLAPNIAKALAVEGAESLAQKALPVVGQILWAMNVAVDVAMLTETIVECACTPSVTTYDISMQMTSTVTVSRDPRDYQFPANANRIVVTAHLDGQRDAISGYTDIPLGQADPVQVVLPPVPSGGTVYYRVDLVNSATNCLFGGATTASMKNLPGIADKVAVQIVEMAVTLDKNTQFEHRQKLGWDTSTSHRTWIDTTTAPTQTYYSMCSDDDCIEMLNGITVNTPTGMAAYAYKAGGQKATLCGGSTAGSMYVFQNISLAQNPDSAYSFSGCGDAEPMGVSYSSGADSKTVGDNFFLQADGSKAPDGSSIFQVRSVTLGQAYDMFQTTSWGRFQGAFDSMSTTTSGQLVGVNRTTHKMQVLALPQAPMSTSDADARVAAPFPVTVGGQGNLVGQLDTPMAVCAYSEAILVLEQGNARVQAFSITADGSAKKLFGPDDSKTPLLALKGAGKPDAANAAVGYIDLAVDARGYIYVLSAPASGAVDPNNYHLDLYDPTGVFLSRTSAVSAGSLAVDTFSNVYTLNYEKIKGTDRVEPSLSKWLPVSSTPCVTASSTAALEQRGGLFSRGRSFVAQCRAAIVRG